VSAGKVDSGGVIHLELSIPGDIRAAETARRALGCFSQYLRPELLEALSLLVNELVTNSLLHACSHGEPIDLVVQTGSDGGTVRAEVRDPGNGFSPPQGTPGLDATSGRGLYLVEQMSDSWGIERTPQTCVWFEMSLSSALRPVEVP
jgi:anti-sigma regulatory factor (Ser/Thr protein kinase)